jgi:virulence factor Mce-like protein
MTHRSIRCATALGVVALLSGCSTGLESLPLSAPSTKGGSYSLTAVFVNALNLPAQAKVKLDGVDIGEVDTIAAKDFTAQVTMRIRDDVPLSTGSTAELRSATPLGDLFVAIRTDPKQTGGAPRLHDGDTIPLASTSAGATVEELLSSAAVLVNGGVVRNLTTLLNGAGKAVGGRGNNVATLLHESSALITRLNARSAQIKTALDNTSDLTTTLSQRQNTLDEALTAAAPAITTIAENRDQIADLTDAVARITRQLQRFPSLQGTDNRSLIADINHLSAAFNDVSVDPNLSLTALNRLIPIIMKLTVGTNIHGAGNVTQLAFGSLPDKNYPGDPQFHGPDGTDYHAMIGSLRYEWNLLLDKVYGPNR